MNSIKESYDLSQNLGLHTFGDKYTSQLVSSFLMPRELAALETVNRRWRQECEPYWRIQAVVQRMIPEAVPAGMSYKQIFKNLYPGVFGHQFYKNHLGDIGSVPPIPRTIIEAADHPDPFGKPGEKIKDNFQLMIIPGTIAIKAPDPMGEEREIQVPMTLNNVAVLVAKHLKQAVPTGFHEDSWGAVLEQHGNASQPKSYWSYQKKKTVGEWLSYNEQTALTREKNLVIMPLIDRVFPNFLTHITSGRHLDDTVTPARTSTFTSSFPGRSVPSSICWKASDFEFWRNDHDSSARLCFNEDRGDFVDVDTFNFDDKVAVGLP